ncbi:MAG TPA: DNA polymerase IV [Burkholderiales bacterium]|nr:DNA polymerase IV [Burkholderiales bacterium]
MRRIVHLDMDAFYASVEQRDDARLRGRPLAVGGSPEGRGVVAAASYEARAFGVRSAMPMARALRLCPELLVVPPHFDLYKQVSAQVMAILRSCTDLVEPLSLDEAYLDVTENRWGMGYASLVAKELKRRIREETACTASAGVAPNKFLAKIASGWRKPDGLTVISPERIEPFLQELPIEALWGVGPVTARKLRALGIERVVDVRTADRAVLHRHVGSLAEWLRRLSYGDDPRPVVPHRAAKSASSETTYADDLEDLQEIRGELARLARETAQWLEGKRLAGRTVTIKVRYADFTTVTRSHTLSRPTADADVISSWATELLHRTQAGKRPVRLLGARVNGLVEKAFLDF